MISAKTSLLAGALLALLSVSLGAFGAHALKDLLAANGRLSTYETAVQYQFYHALGLLLIGVLAYQFPNLKTDWVSGLMLIGILIFSGSLYILCLTGIRWLGAITPIGGAAFIAAWGLLAWKLLKI